MRELLRNWLNGPRDYYKGVILLDTAGGDDSLLAVLRKGPNEFRVNRLEKELRQIFESLDETPSVVPLPKKEKKAVQADERPKNVELYEACKREADAAYKKVMNMRAVLFNLAKDDDGTVNLPNKIEEREKLAIDVVLGFQQASHLYDKANYVKGTGRLPETEDNRDSEYDNLPDSLVKQQLDNARKALSKLKKKEPTPERIELIQKHEENIQKLSAKWHLLRQ